MGKKNQQPWKCRRQSSIARGICLFEAYNIHTKEVTTWVNDKLSPGTYQFEFNGSGLPSGVYFYRLNAGDFTVTKRMMLVK